MTTLYELELAKGDLSNEKSTWQTRRRKLNSIKWDMHNIGFLPNRDLETVQNSLQSGLKGVSSTQKLLAGLESFSEYDVDEDSLLSETKACIIAEMQVCDHKIETCRENERALNKEITNLKLEALKETIVG